MHSHSSHTHLLANAEWSFDFLDYVKLNLNYFIFHVGSIPIDEHATKILFRCRNKAASILFWLIIIIISLIWHTSARWAVQQKETLRLWKTFCSPARRHRPRLRRMRRVRIRSTLHRHRSQSRRSPRRRTTWWNLHGRVPGMKELARMQSGKLCN